MFGSFPIIACVATRDPEDAKKFYRDVLGLPLIREDSFALLFDANGTTLRLTIVQDVAPAKYAVAAWQVPDILAAVNYLEKAGVKIKKFPNFKDQDERGIWTAADGSRVAWFTDPDGNMLSMTQPTGKL
ncbi:MAG TPA: VOC family protein [Bryobacteraceae bacterium]|nr:VOC family protein [Bryobacteraceae bacterium]